MSTGELLFLLIKSIFGTRKANKQRDRRAHCRMMWAVFILCVLALHFSCRLHAEWLLVGWSTGSWFAAGHRGRESNVEYGALEAGKQKRTRNPLPVAECFIVYSQRALAFSRGRFFWPRRMRLWRWRFSLMCIYDATQSYILIGLIMLT